MYGNLWKIIFNYKQSLNAASADAAEVDFRFE